MATATRDRILEATAELFRRHGYTGTGLKQIVAAANAPFGSVYHHFPAARSSSAPRSSARPGAMYYELFEMIMDASPDVVTGVESFFAGAAETLRQTDYADACPIATVALEVASTNEPLRQATADVFDSWFDGRDRAVRRRAGSRRTARARSRSRSSAGSRARSSSAARRRAPRRSRRPARPAVARSARRCALVEDDRLAHGVAAREAVEALVDLVEREPVGQQPLDRQPALAVAGRRSAAGRARARTSRGTSPSACAPRRRGSPRRC